MTNAVSFILMVLAVLSAIALVILIVSIPLAFVGWIIIAATNVFGAGVDYGYWSCALVGLATYVIIHIFANAVVAANR